MQHHMGIVSWESDGWSDDRFKGVRCGTIDQYICQMPQAQHLIYYLLVMHFQPLKKVPCCRSDAQAR